MLCSGKCPEADHFHECLVERTSVRPSLSLLVFNEMNCIPSRSIRRRSATISAGSVCGLFATIFVMGVFPGFWTLAIGLSLGGFFAAGFAVMQSTLIYMTAPPGMSGRFLGLMTISIGTGVIGFANIGLMAELFGGSDALIMIAAQSVLPMALIGWRWKELTQGEDG